MTRVQRAGWHDLRLGKRKKDKRWGFTASVARFLVEFYILNGIILPLRPYEAKG